MVKTLCHLLHVATICKTLTYEIINTVLISLLLLEAQLQDKFGPPTTKSGHFSAPAPITMIV